MAFRNKYEQVMALNPDLLVIQECENDDKLAKALADTNYNQLIWHGNNPHKGVGIISFNNCHIKLNKDFNTEFEYVIPLTLKIEARKINLFAIWAMPHETERRKSYVGQIWGAINYYAKKLNTESILIGDFNSNTIWDKKKRIGNHTDVVDFLHKKNITSIYHFINQMNHGQEKQPTLFLLKKKEKPYHLDYCFASKSLLSTSTTFKIGNYKEWIKWSDHMPIIIDGLFEGKS